MRKKIAVVAGILVAVLGIGYGVLTNANIETTVTVKGESMSLVPTISANPSGGKTVNLLSGDIFNYLNSKIESEDSFYENYYWDYYNSEATSQPNRFAPERVKISWKSEEGAKQYVLKVATNKDLKDAKSYVTFDKEVELKNLYANTTYYYQVVAKFEGKTVKSKIFNFKTAKMTRTVEIDGVSNTRDIGGYDTVDGKVVKQGMIYRGAGIARVEVEGKVLSEITEQGMYDALYDLGIKTDLDLRGTSEAGGITVSPLGEGVNYVLANAPYYVNDDRGINAKNEDFRKGLLKELKTFANKDNYPIYVHCSMGRDRTGTCLFLIESLLGMKENDMRFDYYLSLFSEIGAKGSLTDLDNAFKVLYIYIESVYGNGDVKKGAEAFMLELGLTQDEINSIRNIMLEEVK